MKTRTVFLYAAVLLFVLTMLFIFPFPNQTPFGTRIFNWLGIPAYSNMEHEMGFHYVGIIAMVFLLMSLILFHQMLPKWNGSVVLACILFFLFGPVVLINVYQTFLASGVHAISYEKEWSECIYELNEAEMVADIECILAFENKGKSEVDFEIELVERFYFTHDAKTYSYLNDLGPHVVELYSKEKKFVRLEGQFQISDEENYIYSGNSKGIEVIIRDEAGRERKL
ncbi:hypothetical protein [Halalkalibacter alkalisediminis]|uniref:Uncharacterized protein n=1 Tax=Halalkalibacter alkalisediminis TaxID=935616 RepID=A0ABV6NG76_9BACI|nr:hypothetical protein [Halalkalibacter alkalisediminis]